MVGISFIKYAENVEDIKKFFRSIDAEHLKIIAKVETMECIENIYEILQVVEGISINPKKLKILV
jgi:pyruvate kinase